ncbi:predicted protein [Naegleria gruberi]|uniref:Predicted protein n=1 Tax=Naegleria gruberi TaxID=5762 RepID=D2VQ32_NAEGR|nr:uncharacterized protein NAEGRDRAFT_71145 [Naegleria gruberi]EFC41035.1 predicted protein [Naegleria gruberi]|eukprot:XP_002673779.1 predicted protein [Naegleria gruberi strain NEG-M]
MKVVFLLFLLVLLLFFSQPSIASDNSKLRRTFLKVITQCSCQEQVTSTLEDFNACRMGSFKYQGAGDHVHFTTELDHKTYVLLMKDKYVVLTAGGGEGFDGVNGTVCRKPGYAGDGDLAIKALMNRPLHNSIDQVTGDRYLTDSRNDCIRKVSNQYIDTVVGTGKFGTGTLVDGLPATSVSLDNPVSTVFAANQLFIQEARGILVVKNEIISIFIDPKATNFEITTFGVSPDGSTVYVAMLQNGSSYLKQYHENGTWTNIMGTSKRQLEVSEFGHNKMAFNSSLYFVSDIVFTNYGTVYIIDNYFHNDSSLIKAQDPRIRYQYSAIHRLEVDGSFTTLQVSDVDTRFSDLDVHPDGNRFIYSTSEGKTQSFIAEYEIYCNEGKALSIDKRRCVPICGQYSSEHPMVCNGHGSCLDNGLCNCTDGWSQIDYCETPICFEDSSDFGGCTGHGKCIGPDECACFKGYASSEDEEKRCQFTLCHGTLSNNHSHVCSGRGSCVEVDNCECYTVNGALAYQGDNCEYALCHGIWSYDTMVCSGNGSCINLDECHCHKDYWGDNCQHKYSNSIILGVAVGGCLLVIVIVLIGIVWFTITRKNNKLKGSNQLLANEKEQLLGDKKQLAGSYQRLANEQNQLLGDYDRLNKKFQDLENQKNLEINIEQNGKVVMKQINLKDIENNANRYISFDYLGNFGIKKIAEINMTRSFLIHSRIFDYQKNEQMSNVVEIISIFTQKDANHPRQYIALRHYPNDRLREASSVVKQAIFTLEGLKKAFLSMCLEISNSKIKHILLWYSN